MNGVNDERMTIGLGSTMMEWIEKQAEAKQRPKAWIIRECVQMCMQREQQQASTQRQAAK